MAIETTTSAGMPPIETSHDGLDGSRMTKSSAGSVGDAVGDKVQKLRADATGKVRGLVDEGKAQITQSIDGIVEATREIAEKLDAAGVGPVSRYITQAADHMAGWSESINEKSIEDLFDDTRNFVRSSPAVAVGVAVIGGFIVSRVLKANDAPAPRRGY